MLNLLGIVPAFVTGKVLDVLFGREDLDGYVSSTTPPPPPPLPGD